jgi:hypothetical protein
MLCSSDGTYWEIKENCENGCDPDAPACLVMNEGGAGITGFFSAEAATLYAAAGAIIVSFIAGIYFFRKRQR